MSRQGRSRKLQIQTIYNKQYSNNYRSLSVASGCHGNTGERGCL